MERVRIASRVGARVVSFVLAGMLVALFSPLTAFAATATYSGIAPMPGSSSLVSTPTITVTVYAARGVKGSSNYSMYLDGVKVRPKVTYLMSRYRKFRLTYRRTTPLAPGAHRVTVKVKDLRRHSSSKTWTFTVLAPPPPPAPTEMPVTIENGACSTCHAGYPARHPMTACVLCHGSGRPVPGVEFGPKSMSAHTPACASSVCHQPGDGPFPHVLSADCASCHDGRYFYIPVQHGPATEQDHASTSAQCTLAGCHDVSLTMEHLQYAVNGAAFTCETCHTSTEPAVVRALATGTTVCASCHGASDLHAPATAAHALPVSGCLAGTGCHAATDAAALHGGDCTACHGAGRTPSTACADCHPAEPHPDLGIRHAAAPLGCTVAGCHPSDARTIHATGAGAPGCGACHGAGKPALTLACGTAGCHATSSAAHGSHPVTLAAQSISIAGVAFGTHACSECHALDLVSLHGASCPTCHRSATAATFGGGCAQPACHAATSAQPQHAAIDAAHTLRSATTCVMTGCHSGGTNVAALHAKRGGCAACHKVGVTPTLDCATSGCHSPADAHPVSQPHPNMLAAHSTGLPSTCATPGCHLAELAVLHAAAKGCPTCHGSGAIRTVQCSTIGCHGSEVTGPALHPDYVSAHITPAVGCTVAGCHAANAITVHTTGVGAPGCTACHAAGKPALTLTCTTAGCHVSDVTAPGLHPSYGTGHLAPRSGCTAVGCHEGDAIVVHTTGATRPGCPACHAPGKPALTLVCETAGCHRQVPPPHLGHPVSPAAEPVTIAGEGFGLHECAECHEPLDLIDLHGRDCRACHAKPLTGVTLEGGCAQTACHAAGALAQHAAIDADHTLTEPPSCVGADCHDGGENVAALHRSAGCITCHADGVAPTVVCSTAGCHGSRDPHPVSGPHPGMTASHTSGLPAACVRSGCHGADLPALHAAADGCATCHRRGEPATQQCVSAGCHTSGVSALHASHPASLAPASIRINGLSLGTYACTACHSSTDLQVIHAGAKGCATCHPDAATAVGRWDGGCTQAACHGPLSPRPMHAGVDAAHTVATQPKCTTPGCHQGNSNVGGRDFALMHFPTAKGCANCHAPGRTRAADCAACHSQWATGDHQADHGSCNDCHAPYVWDPVTSTANKGARLTPVHWSLFDAAWTLSIGRAQIRPGYPYGDYTQLVYPPTLGTPGPYSSSYFERTVTYTCTACHTGAGRTWVHPAYNNYTCGSGGDCHEHHYNWDPPQGSPDYVHNTPPASWTATMGW